MNQNMCQIPLCIFCNKQDLDASLRTNIKQIGVDLGLYEWINYKQIFKSSKELISYNCPDNVLDVITDYMTPKEIVPINEKKAMFDLFGCCATLGDGLYEGLDWLSNKMK